MSDTFGKIMTKIYDSSICENWKTMVVFQQLIILSDEFGVLDMTPEAIARRTNIPLAMITEAICELSKPDKRSKSTRLNGRRIVLLDEHRDWGWLVVNKVEYRKSISKEEKRERDRVRQEKLRKSNKNGSVANNRSASLSVHEIGHTDTHSDSYSDNNIMLGKPNDVKPKNNFKEDAITILSFMNKITGRNYQPVPANIDLIKARLKDGVSVQDCKSIIGMKWQEWKDDPKFVKYVRPATIFNKTKFAQYEGELCKEES